MEENNNENNVNNVNNVEQPKKKKGNGLKRFFILLLVIIIVAAFALLIRYAIVGDSYFAPFEKLFGLEEEIDDDEEDEIVEEKETNKTAGRMSLLAAEATEKGVTHYTLELDIAELIEMGLDFYLAENSYSLDGMSNNNSEYTTKKLSTALISEDYNDYSIEAYSDDYEEDSLSTVEDQIEEMIEYLDGGKIVIDMYAKGNEIIQVIVTIEYDEMLENLYDYMVENEVEEISSFETAEDFKNYVETTLGMYLNKSIIMDAIEEELDNEDIDMDIEEIEECFDMIAVDGAYEFYFTLSEDMNEMIAEFVEDNAEDMEDEGIDPDNFVESMVEYYNETMEDEGYDQFVIEID